MPDSSPQQNVPSSQPQAVTCLGCGCVCDDIEATVSQNRIVESRNLCPLGERWLCQGDFPDAVRLAGREATLEEALAETGRLIRRNPARLLILVGDDLTLESQRLAIALGDQLGANLDGLLSGGQREGVLAIARRGRVSGTLGHLRHRCDLLLWWGCDPSEQFPRFLERFVEAESRFVADRRQIAIDIGPATGLSQLSERIAIEPSAELDFLGQLRGYLAGHLHEPPAAIQTLLDAFAEATNIAILYDAEASGPAANPSRAEYLQLLAQQLHGQCRAAVWGLRAGGNRGGFEAALTWQSGFPMSVDFGKGVPEFVAGESLEERLDRGRYQTVLLLGNSPTILEPLRRRLEGIETIVIGPLASEADFDPIVAIDTGLASIHEGGLVLRMDGIPIETQALLEHPRTMEEILSQLNR